MISIEEIAQTYRLILGRISISESRTIIQNLNQAKSTATFFQDTVKSLPVLQFDKEEFKITIPGFRPHSYYLIDHDYGTFGKIYKSEDSEFVIKEIVCNEAEQEKLELLIREVFLELFIQTVLSKDQKCGKHVCMPHSLFRSEHSHKLNAPFSLFLKMEYVPTSLKQHFEDDDLTIIKYVNFLIDLCEILSHFEKTYKFKHRDLHVYNVLFSDKVIKIIDFGMSRIELDNITYSLQNNPIQKQPAEGPLKSITISQHEESYDMLIFMSSFIQKFKKCFKTEKDKKFAISLLSLDDGTNIYNYMEKNSTEQHIFHNMYDWVIVNNWPEHLQRELGESKELFSPDYMARGLRKLFKT